jgi:chromosome segregation ATPase
MTDLTLESLRSELAQSLHSELAPMRAQLESLHSEQAPIRAQLGSLHSELAPMRAQLESLHSELAPMRARLESLHSELAPMRAQLDGLPLMNRALTLLQQDMRSLRVAFSDFARTNITAGEVEALHFDVNRVQAENAELQSRLATVERLLEQQQKERS